MASADGVTDGRAEEHPAALPRPRSSLRYVFSAVWGNHKLRRVVLAFSAFNFGEHALWVAMLVYAYAQGGVTESGLVATVLLVPAAVLAPALAALGERWGAGSALVSGYLVQAATSGAVAVALLADAPPLLVYGLLVGPTVAFTMTRPIQSAITPGLARKPEELTATNVATGWIESLALLAGPAVTGVILAVASPAAVFTVVTVGCMAGAVLVAPLRRTGTRSSVEAEPDDAQEERVSGSWSLVREDGNARLLILLLAVQCVTWGALDILVVELAQGVLGLGSDWVGFLLGAFGAGGVLAVVVTARLVGLARLALPLMLAIAVWSLAYVGLAALPAALGAVFLVLVAGSARSTFDVSGRTLLQRVVRPDVLARVFGLLEGLQMAAFAVGTLLVPMLVAAFGVPLAFVGFALILPLVAVAGGRRLLDIDRHATVPVVQIALLRSMPLFAPLSPPTLESLARSLEPLSVPAGVDVIRRGDVGDGFYVIADGEVEIIRDGRVVATRTRGEGFGEIALLYDVPRTATVRARRECELYLLERDAFLLGVTGHAGAHRAAADLAAERLAELGVEDERDPQAAAVLADRADQVEEPSSVQSSIVD